MNDEWSVLNHSLFTPPPRKGGGRRIPVTIKQEAGFGEEAKLLHLESRETNLMSLALLFHYLMLGMFRMLIHPSSGVCDLFVELFHGLYSSGSMCVGVTLWFGCGGVVSVCKLKHCIRIPHHHNQTTTSHQHTSNQSNTTHEITQQISRKLLRMDVLTSETC